MNSDPPTEPETKHPPVVLSIAGSDCSSGAGIQADLKTFAYFQTYGLTAVTSIVAESPGKVVSTEAVSPEILSAQLKILAESFDIKGIKTGMLATAELCEIVVNFLEDLEGAESTAPIVVDPVLMASSGAPLLDPEALELYRRRLLPLATLATPNLDEAAALLNLPPITSHQEMDSAARKFTGQYQCMTLLKGGHLDGSDATDVLWDGTEIHDFTAARIHDKTPHGTGCTYSAAITALLAHDYPLLETIKSAKDYITVAISQSEALSNSEIDTLNHFPISID
ncbi:MAG: bifunctional hydroxymethylpyrimidine kinase/phosphomethylpyrimidine kinase [Verrucomicrobia bacterium]|nr:bifunctional hydroxymethylpyrimidine kinase/phosphomethylpyrimidine kinase [Verrucomicrobiota bacterium]